MTHAEKRLIMQNERDLRALEVRVADQARLIMLLLQRKQGRPTKAEAEQIEALAERVSNAA